MTRRPDLVLTISLAALVAPVLAIGQTCHTLLNAWPQHGPGCYENLQCAPGSHCEEMVQSVLAPELPEAPNAKEAGHKIELYLPKSAYNGAASSSGVLDQLRSFYQTLQAVELDATVWVWLPQQSGHGALHYAAAGDRYYMRATSDRELGLSFDVEMAYDLERHQLLNTNLSTLSLYTAPPSYLPVPFPNPFFLPVAFLGMSDESCGGCEPTVKEIQSRWQARTASAFVSQEDASRGALIVGGSELQGEPFFYRVYFVGADHRVVSRIDLVRPNGRIIEQVVLQDYRSAGGGLFPYHIALTALAADGTPAASVRYTIDQLRLSAAVPVDQFTLGYEKAKVVIDEDRHAFLKHPSLNKGAAVLPEKN
jgi:hypothetical protein